MHGYLLCDATEEEIVAASKYIVATIYRPKLNRIKYSNCSFQLFFKLSNSATFSLTQIPKTRDVTKDILPNEAVEF